MLSKLQKEKLTQHCCLKALILKTYMNNFTPSEKGVPK